MKWIVRLAVAALLVVLAREVRHRQSQLAVVTNALAEQRTGLEASEAEIESAERRIDEAAERLTALDARVTAVEEKYPDGIPSDEYEDYEALVGERNEAAEAHNDLVTRQRLRVRDYQGRVDRHNDGVGEANALAAESTPWAIMQRLWARVTGG
jgi:chromosome segregation ATPase